MFNVYIIVRILGKRRDNHVFLKRIFRVIKKQLLDRDLYFYD